MSANHEKSRRGAAAMAKATAGRARRFDDKTKYNRKREKLSIRDGA